MPRPWGVADGMPGNLFAPSGHLQHGHDGRVLPDPPPADLTGQASATWPGRASGASRPRRASANASATSAVEGGRHTGAGKKGDQRPLPWWRWCCGVDKGKGGDRGDEEDAGAPGHCGGIAVGAVLGDGGYVAADCVPVAGDLLGVTGTFIWPQIDDQRQRSLVTAGAQTTNTSEAVYVLTAVSAWAGGGHSPLPKPITERDQVCWPGAAGSARNADFAPRGLGGSAAAGRCRSANYEHRGHWPWRPMLRPAGSPCSRSRRACRPGGCG
jgi:hypothetical protein